MKLSIRRWDAHWRVVDLSRGRCHVQVSRGVSLVSKRATRSTVDVTSHSRMNAKDVIELQVLLREAEWLADAMNVLAFQGKPLTAWWAKRWCMGAIDQARERQVW